MGPPALGPVASAPRDRFRDRQQVTDFEHEVPARVVGAPTPHRNTHPANPKRIKLADPPDEIRLDPQAPAAALPSRSRRGHGVRLSVRHAGRLVLAACGPRPGENPDAVAEFEAAGRVPCRFLTIGAVRTAGHVQGKVVETHTPEAQFETPYGPLYPISYYALAAQQYLHRSGASREALAGVAIPARARRLPHPSASRSSAVLTGTLNRPVAATGPPIAPLVGLIESPSGRPTAA